MRKIVAAFALIGLVFASLPAQADGYYRHHHRHGGGNGDALVGGLIGGLIIGSILTAPRSERRYEYYEDEYPAYRCYSRFRGYDYYGRPVYMRYCE